MARHTFFCIDGHTCGNPVRLVAGGGPRIRATSMFERRQTFLADYDWIRTGLMFEPRGHDMMSGTILYPPSSDDYDAGVLYIETTGCLPMCGHGTIGTVTMAIEEGLLKPKTPGIAPPGDPGRSRHRRIPDGRRVCGLRQADQRSVIPGSRRP